MPFLWLSSLLESLLSLSSTSYTCLNFPPNSSSQEAGRLSISLLRACASQLCLQQVETCPCPNLLFFSLQNPWVIVVGLARGRGGGGRWYFYCPESWLWPVGGSFYSRFTPPSWEQKSPVLGFHLELYQEPFSSSVLTAAGLVGRESPAYSAFVAFTFVVTLYIGISISYWNAESFAVNFLVLGRLCITVRRCTGISDSEKMHCLWIARPEGTRGSTFLKVVCKVWEG